MDPSVRRIKQGRGEIKMVFWLRPILGVLVHQHSLR
jgi:hypothetical protein